MENCNTVGGERERESWCSLELTLNVVVVVEPGLRWPEAREQCLSAELCNATWEEEEEKNGNVLEWGILGILILSRRQIWMQRIQVILSPGLERTGPPLALE